MLHTIVQINLNHLIRQRVNFFLILIKPTVIRLSAGDRVFDGDRYQRQGRTLLIGDFPGERNFVLCRQT